MERVEITKSGEEFRIEGFPDAIRVLGLSGRQAQRLAHLVLHKADLKFAQDCLEQIERYDSSLVSQALWRVAIAYYMKCFGQSKARFSLEAKQVYKGDSGAVKAFRYFKTCATNTSFMMKTLTHRLCLVRFSTEKAPILRLQESCVSP